MEQMDVVSNEPLLSLPTGKLQYGPYSPSRLETGICGWAFKKQYIEKDRRVRLDDLAAARGSVVHEVFEEMNAEMMKGNYAFTEQQCRKWIAEKMDMYPAAYEDMETILECIRLYAENPPKNLPEDAMIEQKLALDINLKECDYDSPLAMIRGRADLLWFDDDLNAHILDYKTQPNIEEANTFQMGVYALVIAKSFNMKQVYTTIQFARYGRYSKAQFWSEEDLYRIEQTLLARIEAIENRTQWEPTPHNGCQYCDYRTECPVFKDRFEVNEQGLVKITDDDVFKVHDDIYRAQKLAGVIVQLEELLSLGKKELRNFVKKNEQPIVTGNKAFMFKAADGVDFQSINKAYEKKVELFDIMAKHGVDARRFINFNKTQFNPVFIAHNENEAFIKELSEALPKTTKTTYGCYKV